MGGSDELAISADNPGEIVVQSSMAALVVLSAISAELCSTRKPDLLNYLLLQAVHFLFCSSAQCFHVRNTGSFFTGTVRSNHRAAARDGSWIAIAASSSGHTVVHRVTSCIYSLFMQGLTHKIKIS